MSQKEGQADIRITKEMLLAGEKAAADSAGTSPVLLAEAVYRAMETVRLRLKAHVGDGPEKR